MATNKNVVELYTRGRHRGFRIIHIGHNAKSIGPALRTNIAYLFISDRIQQADLVAVCRDFGIEGDDEVEVNRLLNTGKTRDRPRFLFIDKSFKTM